METKMKKIPFDLERAKKGEVINMIMDNTEYYLIAELDGKAWLKWNDKEHGHKSSIFSINGTWFHLIPDEPKPERWAVVEIMSTHENEYAAKQSCKALNDYSDKLDDNDVYTVVKLADDE